tara:strand:- start:477 stop:689 length:213 start_codon:yes stop_codon:yes gene_type:complete
MTLSRSKYSPQFENIQQAHDWAETNYPDTEEIFFLIFDKEDEAYQFVNESRLSYLKDCWGLDFYLVGTWE